ncbi:MAG TPA: hypothetical protein VHA09_00010 [Nitrososphaera sp.]|nr:hypothetical protein [Nitrososphaera sp.]
MSDFVSDVSHKLKEVTGAVDNLAKFQEKSKREVTCVENDKFADSNLYEGYSCYD